MKNRLVTPLFLTTMPLHRYDVLRAFDSSFLAPPPYHASEGRISKFIA